MPRLPDFLNFMPSDKASSYLSRLGPGARVFRVVPQPHVWSEPPSGSKMDSLLSPDPKSPSADSVPRNHSASSSSTGNEFLEGCATPASCLGFHLIPPSRTKATEALVGFGRALVERGALIIPSAPTASYNHSRLCPSLPWE